MIFTRLTITNFGVYRGRHEFELRPQYGEHARPIVLFGGKNGAGKTTILEAIRLCLYGRAALGQRARRVDYETYIGQRFHRPAEAQYAAPVQSASVGLMIEHTHAGVRSLYDAVRSWRRDGLRLREQISIYKDGQPLQEIAAEHWDDFLRDLIPPGVADLFFFDAEQIQAFADEERESEALASAVRGLLNLDLIGRLQSDLGMYLRQQAKRERSRLHHEAEQAQAAYEAYAQQYLERKQDQAQLIAHQDRTLVQLDKARQALLREGAGFVQQRDALEARQREVTQRIEQTHAAIRELATGLLPFAVAPQWCMRLRERLQYEADVEQARLVYAAEQAQAAQAALKLLDPTFQAQTAPSVNPQDWARIASAVQAILQPDPCSETGALRHALSAQDRDTLYAWIDDAVQHVPQRVHTLMHAMEELEAEQSRLEHALKQVPADAVANPLIEDFNRWAEEKGRLDEQLKRIAEALRQSEHQLAQLDRDRNQAWQRLAAAGDADARVERAAKVQVILEQYLAHITALKVQELEQALARYFNLLCRKQVLVREVKIDPNRFTVALYGANRAPVSKADLSAGERQLYATALLWALRSVSGRALPIIVDTPMGRLDSNHRAAMLAHFFPNAAHQIILLSTDTEIDGPAYQQLQPAIAHTFRLDFDDEQGCTQVQRAYVVDQPREAAA